MPNFSRVVYGDLAQRLENSLLLSDNGSNALGLRCLREHAPMSDSTRSLKLHGQDFGLTPVERDVIVLIAHGYSSKETAKELDISQGAVDLCISTICNKIRVENQIELILFALYHGLVNSHGSSSNSTTPKAGCCYRVKRRGSDRA